VTAKRPWRPGPRDPGFAGADPAMFPPVIGNVAREILADVAGCVGRCVNWCGPGLVPCHRPTRVRYGQLALCLGCAFVVESVVAGRNEAALLEGRRT